MTDQEIAIQALQIAIGNYDIIIKDTKNKISLLQHELTMHVDLRGDLIEEINQIHSEIHLLSSQDPLQ